MSKKISGKAKPFASEDEAFLLISARREAARETLKEMAEEMGAARDQTWPNPDQILWYLNNMVYALELMLKLLSGNHGSHEVGEMYETVFSKPHANEDFMATLRESLSDQKYLHDFVSCPAGDGRTLAHFIPEIEALYATLRKKIIDRGQTVNVLKEMFLPREVGETIVKQGIRFTSRSISFRDMPDHEIVRFMTEVGREFRQEMMLVAERAMKLLDDEGSLRVAGGRSALPIALPE